MSNIKLITLNVEGNRHWDRIIPFLERESPDVLCLQEFIDQDLDMVINRFHYDSIFSPITITNTKVAYRDNDLTLSAMKGTALLSRLPIHNKQSVYYHEPAKEIQLFRKDNVQATVHRPIVWGGIQKDGAEFIIASTHFTWTPDGILASYQDVDMQSLMKILDTIPSLMLCGDFNIPRGYNKLYEVLTKRFKDNIPSNIKTTLDLNLHKVGKDPIQSKRVGEFVVDYIFSTSDYQVSNVRVQNGVSDHCAVIADISR